MPTARSGSPTRRSRCSATRWRRRSTTAMPARSARPRGRSTTTGCWSTCSPASSRAKAARRTRSGKPSARRRVTTRLREGAAMLTQAQVDEYNRTGAIVVPDILSLAEVEELRRMTDEFVHKARQVTKHDDVYDLEDTHSPQEPRVRRIKTPHLHH